MAKVKSELAIKQGESICEQWNYHWPIGTQVTLIDDHGNPILTETTSEAWTLGHGEPVVKVRCKSGGYMLSRLIPSNPHRPARIEAIAEVQSREELRSALSGFSPEYLTSCGIV